MKTTLADHILPRLCALIVCWAAATASAETVTQKWTRIYNPSSGYDAPGGVAMDSAGNVIVAGIQDNYGDAKGYLAKYAAADGSIIWSILNKGAFSPAILPNGDVILDGHARYSGADGHLIWESPNVKIAEIVKIDGAGDIVVAGSLVSGVAFDGDRLINTYDAYTAKLSRLDGHIIWEKQYNGPANNSDFANALAIDSHGNVVVTGSSQDSAGYPEVYTAKYAAGDGQLLWERRYSGPNPTHGDVALGVAVDFAGDVLVTGLANDFDLYAAKYSGADGHVIWEKSVAGHSSRRGLSVVADLEGNAMVVGYDGFNFYLAKYRASDGNLVWEKFYLPPSVSNAGQLRRVILDRAGDLLVSGVFNSGPADRTDNFIGKFAGADGALLWQQSFDSPTHLEDTDAAGGPVALAPDDSVAVTIPSQIGGQDYQFVTTKYQVTGVQRPNSAVNGLLGPTSLIVNHSTRPIGSGASFEKTIAPMAATDGAFDAFLEFVAVQLSQVPGLEVQVQYSTLPSDHDSWFALQNGNKGRLQRDPNTGNFIAKSSHFPRLSNVYFRAKIKAPGYNETFSNVVGPFDLSQKPQTLPATGFRIFGGDQPSSVFAGQQLIFTAGQSSQAAGLKVRVQYSFSPLMESSWTDLPNGTMSPEFNYYIVSSNSYPTSNSIYFRAISSAPGAIDSVSNYIGPWRLTNNDLPAVHINLAENQTFSRNSSVPVSVTATDSNGISRVELYVDGENQGVDTEAPFEFDLRGIEPGTHSLVAFAYDNLFTPNVSNVIERITLTDSRFTIYNRTSDGAWNDPSGWSPQSIPGANDVVEISSGRTVTLSGSVSVRMLSLSGNLRGPGSLSVINQFSWISGQLDSLTLNIGAAARFLSFSGADKSLNNVTVNNAGKFVVAGKGVVGNKGTTLNNTGTFAFAGQLGDSVIGTTPLAAFGSVSHNGGVIQLAGGKFVAPSYTQNAPAQLNLGNRLIGNDGNTLIGNDGNSLIGNDGNSLIGNDGNSLIGNDGNSLIGNDGNSLIGNDGNSLIGNDGNSLALLNGAGIISQRGGGLISDNGAAFRLNGGVISGFGRIDYPNFQHDGGAFHPGHSPGAVDITGNYTQGPGASLILEVGGTNGFAGNYDMVAVKGTATLAGDLVVHSLNGYQSQGFGVVPFGYGARSGQFKTVSANSQVTLGTQGALITADGTNPPLPRALNISTRLPIQGGDKDLFAGFIVTGPAGSTKKVMIRGIGPSLGQFGVSGTIPDPLLELHSSGPTVTNDSWQLAPNKNEIPAGFAPTDGRECVIIAALAPGDYSAILKGAHGEVGVGLAEVYDLDSASPAQLANIATRGLVQTDDNVLIGGFIIGGNEPAKVLVRAVGPSLSAFGIQGALQDPILEVHDSNGGIITNDNWRETDEAAIASTTIPPSHDKEAAVLATLVPGNYTAVVRGKDNTTGIAVVQAYNIQ
ncbi:MAG: hypothetical protein QOH88_2169 [Verrucomicrobiota bacterium]|jgi:hypothetical protein